ncbi:MAG: polysaccharide deacetylase family protein [Oscillospiraceae bacterium]
MENNKPLAALTFDDGPNTFTTRQVIEKLAQYGVPASFFLVGDNITEESAAVSREALRQGCEIHNHSRTHSAMPQLTPEEMKAEIAYTNERIKSMIGAEPRFFRPPYIAVSGEMFDNIDLPFIAGIGAEDWLDEVSAEQRAEKVLSQVCDGSIILLHDMRGNYRTVNALDIIIPELISRGYELVTVSELFRRAGVEPVRRRVYSNVYQTTEY